MKLTEVHKKIINYYNTNNNYFHKLLKGSRFKYRAIISLIKEFYPTNSNILDIGCGTGNLLYYLYGEKYHNLSGVDACDKYVKYANKKLNGKVKKCDIIHFNNLIKYDCVICADFFEHAVNPEKICDIISTLLLDDGMLIIQGPNMISILSRKEAHIQNSIIVFLNKYVQYLKGSMSIIYTQPKLDSNTHNINDSDACYIVNPFDLIMSLNKHGYNILYLSTFYNPVKSYKPIAKHVVWALMRLPIICYMGGSVFVVAKKNSKIRNNNKIRKNVHRVMTRQF